jgi:hypothetical protein
VVLRARVERAASAVSKRCSSTELPGQDLKVALRDGKGHPPVGDGCPPSPPPGRARWFVAGTGFEPVTSGL